MKFSHDLLKQMPKVELHLHLDCSLNFNFVKTLLPKITRDEYIKNFAAPDKSADLSNFLKCATNSIRLLQTEKALRTAVHELFVELEKDNVIYAEIRFAPLLHTIKGLLPEEVVEIVDESISINSKRKGIKAGLILCTLREFSEQESLQTVKLVERYFNNTNVLGFDIAGDEAGYSIESHQKAFDYAITKDIPRTAHAGEARGADSVWETLAHFEPQRIGHGVRSIEDEKLIEYLIKNDIFLEINPTCNIQTNIYKEYADHPIDILYKSGTSLGISTDGRSLSNITLSMEYEKLAKTFNWSLEQFKKCNINSLSHSFISQDKKKKLSHTFNSRFNALVD